MIPGMSNSTKRAILSDLVNIINLLRAGERWDTKDRSILFYLTNNDTGLPFLCFDKEKWTF